MNGGDNSVTGGVISATTLIVANGIVGRLTYHSKRMEKLIEGRPEIVIHNGRVFTDIMKREKLTHHELNAALRAAGCTSVDEVHYALLENTGQIIVQLKTTLKSVCRRCSSVHNHLGSDPRKAPS